MVSVETTPQPHEMPTEYAVIHSGFIGTWENNNLIHVRFGFLHDGQFTPVNFADQKSLDEAKKNGVEYKLCPTSSGGWCGKEPSVAMQLNLLADKSDTELLTTVIVDYSHTVTHLPRQCIYFTKENDVIYKHSIRITPDDHTVQKKRLKIFGTQHPKGGSGGIAHATQFAGEFFRNAVTQNTSAVH